MADGLYVGLLSGTSVDAIDAALLHFERSSMRLVDSLATPIPPPLKAELLHLTECDLVSPDDIGLIDRRFGGCLADAVMRLLQRSDTSPESVRAIGSHGQTIRHRPARPDAREPGFTWQIGDPNIVAELTGICTVADFRRRDMAAGGQGAPLVPAFHEWAFRSESTDRVILNIGGMANISVLPASPSAPVIGFDTGPGNALMDAWIRRHRNEDYDCDGRWANSGDACPGLLARMRSHRYFSLPAPKSTGREEFNLAWLDEMLSTCRLEPADVQATLLELTAGTITDAILEQLGTSGEVFVCGGGAHNRQLMDRLRLLLAPRPVELTSALGIAPDWVEAGLFAWLARQTLNGLPGNLPTVTGAAHAAILGAVYPGRTA